VAIRDDGWDSAWDDEDAMTADDHARRREHLENAVWREREQRMMRMRANRQPDAYALEQQRKVAEAEDRRLASIQEADDARRQRNFAWSAVAFCLFVVLVLFLVL
jgi:Flp pilus assembly protein TadB